MIKETSFPYQVIGYPEIKAVQERQGKCLILDFSLAVFTIICYFLNIHKRSPESFFFLVCVTMNSWM